MNSILETIGKTPVVPLKKIGSAETAEIFAKYEAGNPSFSVKDRVARAMIEKAEKEGKIKADTLIVDATAGNTGVALALMCAVKGLKLVLFMPEDASLERRKMFQGFGAELQVTPKEEGVSGALKRAEAFAKKAKNSFMPNQFEDSAVVEAHEKTTAQEILADFPEGLDALVCGVGTGGTLTGVGRVLKEKFPRVQIVAVEPEASPVLSGGPQGAHKIQQLGLGFIPKNLNRSLIDRICAVSDADAYQMTKNLARYEGLLVGISSGAHVQVALKVAQELGKGKKVLTFLSDAGQRYFSIERFFQN